MNLSITAFKFVRAVEPAGAKVVLTVMLPLTNHHLIFLIPLHNQVVPG